MMYRNQFNYNSKAERGERFTKPSQTIQGDAYSIQDLYQKFATGNVPPIYRDGLYMDSTSFDDPDFREVANMDMVERQQLADNLSANVKKMQEDVKKSRQKPASVPVVGSDPNPKSNPDPEPPK